MRTWVDVRICANRYASPSVRLTRDVVDQLELGTRLDVEEQNISIKRITDLVCCFTDPGKNDFVCGVTRAEDAKQFTAGDNVEARSPFCKPAKKVDVRICLDGVTDQVRDRFKVVIENADVAAERLFAIDVNRSADIIGNSSKRNFFTVKLTTAVL